MKIFILCLLALGVGLIALTQYLALQISVRFPPQGLFAKLGDVSLHFKDYPAAEGSGQLPIVFIHGASGNLRDLEEPLADKLKGKHRLIFIDRPGHGHSSRGSADDMHLPWGQARIVSELLKHLNIDKAIIVGHSYGGGVAASFAVNHPMQTGGLIFLAPATHPWPGAGVTWHYDVTNVPVLGFLFAETVAIPFGHLVFEDGVKGVFKPGAVPANYLERTGVKLLLRPDVFRNNAADVSALYKAVVEVSPRYGEIDVPTSIITGDQDDVVLANIHSVGLKKQIKGAKLIWLEGVGHSPAWTSPEIVAQEIERVNRAARSK